MRKTSKVLEDVCGTKIKGWRCPDYRVSPQTLDILSAERFAWDSSLLNDDLPCLFQCAGGTLIELPFTTSTADKTYIGYPYPMRGGPDGLASVWNSEFDVLYRESEHVPRFMILSHPDLGDGPAGPAANAASSSSSGWRATTTFNSRAAAKSPAWCNSKVEN